MKTWRIVVESLNGVRGVHYRTAIFASSAISEEEKLGYSVISVEKIA